MRHMALFRIATLAAFLALSPSAHAATEASAPSDGQLCRFQTDQQGRLARFPTNMLTALSFVESGRWDDIRKEKTAWPWTVTAEGRGRFFQTKQEAVSEVLRLRARGIRNIDVGCMQINLYYHADAFPSLDAAFDPATNVAYAVDFLQSLKEETGSWQKAAIRYHSATPEYAQRYAGLLNRALAELNGTDTFPLAGQSDLVAQLTKPLPDRPLAFAHLAAVKARAIPRAASLYTSGQLAAISAKARSAKLAQEETERKREAAKSFADNWRAQRMQDWLKAKKTTQTADAS